MKLYSIVIKIKEKFSDASEEEIVAIINALEAKMVAEIFEPVGILKDKTPLNAEPDMERDLLLSSEFENLYYYYVLAILSARDMDIESYENYSTLFNITYSELSLYIRRNNRPVSKTKLGGISI